LSTSTWAAADAPTNAAPAALSAQPRASVGAPFGQQLLVASAAAVESEKRTTLAGRQTTSVTLATPPATAALVQAKHGATSTVSEHAAFPVPGAATSSVADAPVVVAPAAKKSRVRHTESVPKARTAGALAKCAPRAAPPQSDTERSDKVSDEALCEVIKSVLSEEYAALHLEKQVQSVSMAMHLRHKGI